MFLNKSSGLSRFPEYFMIAAAQVAPADGDVAVLESPVFSGVPKQCFNFYFSFLVRLPFEVDLTYVH